MPLTNPSTASGGSTAASTGVFTQSADNLMPLMFGINDAVFPVSGGITPVNANVELSTGLTTLYTCSTDKVAFVLNSLFYITNVSGSNSTAVDVYVVGPGSSAGVANRFVITTPNNNSPATVTVPKHFMEPGEAIVIGNAAANIVANAMFWEMDATTSMLVKRGQVSSTAGTSIYTCPDGKKAYFRQIEGFLTSTAASVQGAAVVLPDGSTYHEKYAFFISGITGRATFVFNQNFTRYLSSGEQVFLRSPSTEPLNYRMCVFETTG